MPIWTTSVKRRPPEPAIAPERTASAKAQTRASSARTSAITSRPSTTSVASALRRATWSTLRFSVTLMRWPENMASRLASTPQARASASSFARAASVRLVLEKSSRRPAPRAL